MTLINLNKNRRVLLDERSEAKSARLPRLFCAAGTAFSGPARAPPLNFSFSRAGRYSGLPQGTLQFSAVPRENQPTARRRLKIETQLTLVLFLTLWRRLQSCVESLG